MDIETKNQVFLQKYARKKILVMGKNYELALPFNCLANWLFESQIHNKTENSDIQ